MYYKKIKNGYITMIGIGQDEKQITKKEYSTILKVISEKPEPTESVDYRLKEDLTWEEFPIEPILEEEE